MNIVKYQNPLVESALHRAHKLAHTGHEPEAFEALGAGLRFAGWFQVLAWGRKNSPRSVWERWVELYCERDLLLFRMITEQRHEWSSAFDDWKREVAELVTRAAVAFECGPQWWRTAKKPPRKLTLQDELDAIHRAAGAFKGIAVTRAHRIEDIATALTTSREGAGGV